MKKLILELTVLAITLFTPALITGAASAATCDSNGLPAGCSSATQACSSLDVLNSTQGCASNSSSSKSGNTAVDSIITKVVNTISVVAGIVTVIMIILAGFQFITSGGDSSRVSKARTALFYSMIGLLVVALAQFLVIFVLNNLGA